MSRLAIETQSVHIDFDGSDTPTPVISPGSATGGVLTPDGSGNATAVIFFDSSNDKIYEVPSASFRGMGYGSTATLIFVTTDGDQAASFNLTNSWGTYTLSGIHIPQSKVTAVKLVLNGASARADDWNFDYRQMLDDSGQTSTTMCNTEGITGGDKNTSGNTISVRYGEKRETITDLRINTPNEPLTFTRYYRQFYQNTLQFMGLGWSHNHNYRVRQQDLGGGLKRIRVQMPDGGEILLLNNTGAQGFYRGERGVQAELTEYPGETDQYYYLNMLDGNKYYFDKDSEYITSHILPNGDTWVYHYSTTGFDTGLLSYVEDNYGNQIKFRYIDNAGQFNHKMLWRVGDQLTSNMGGTPTGRYLEFTYTVEPNNPSNAKALLTTVRDVRGQTWEYEYDPHIDYNGIRLNTLRYYRSPAVAAISNNFVNGRLILKNLTYTYQGINPNKYISKTVQKLGKEVTPYLREETYEFFPDEAAARTEVTIAGKKTYHYFDYGVYYGVEIPSESSNYQRLDENYRTHKLIDGQQNTNVLNWSESGHFLTQVQDAENEITAFEYSDDNAIDGVLEKTIDALGRETRYKYHYAAAPYNPDDVRKLDAQCYPNCGGMIMALIFY